MKYDITPTRLEEKGVAGLAELTMVARHVSCAASVKKRGASYIGNAVRE